MASDKGSESREIVKKDSTEKTHFISPSKPTLDVSREVATRAQEARSHSTEHQAITSLKKVPLDKDNELLAMYKHKNIKKIMESQQSSISKAFGGDNSQSPYLDNVMYAREQKDVRDKYDREVKAAHKNAVASVHEIHAEDLKELKDEISELKAEYKELRNKTDTDDKNSEVEIKDVEKALVEKKTELTELKKTINSQIEAQAKVLVTAAETILKAEQASLDKQFDHIVKAKEKDNPIWKATKVIPKTVFRLGRF